jgi:hypothetical protein
VQIKRCKWRPFYPQTHLGLPCYVEIKGIILTDCSPFTLFDKIRNGTDKIENEEPMMKLGTLENAFEDVLIVKKNTILKI